MGSLSITAEKIYAWTYFIKRKSSTVTFDDRIEVNVDLDGTWLGYDELLIVGPTTTYSPNVGAFGASTGYFNFGKYTDTSYVTDMSYWFGACPNLNPEGIQNLDTSNVTLMVNMFYGCRSLNKDLINGILLK